MPTQRDGRVLGLLEVLANLDLEQRQVLLDQFLQVVDDARDQRGDTGRVAGVGRLYLVSHD
jgi:hypothetical protein